MKRKCWRLILHVSLGCLLFGLFGCATTVKPNPPNIPVVMPKEPPASQIQVPFNVSLRPLFDLAEKEFPKKFEAAKYNEWFGTGGPDAPSCGIGCGYEINRGPLAFSMANNTLNTKISFNYWISCRVRWPFCGPLITAGCGENSNDRRRANGTLSTKLSLKPDWTPVVTTKNNGVTAENDCSVGPFGVADMTDKVVGGFNAGFDKLAQTLDSKINEKIAIRPDVEKIWAQILNPIKIDNDVWLSLRPDKFSITPLTLSDNKISFKIGLIAKPVFEIGVQPPASSKPLPNLELSDSIGDTFIFFVPVNATYSAVEKELREKLKIPEDGLRFPPTGSKYIKITDVSIYGYGTKAVVKISFKGSANGFAYLEGSPTFNPVTNILTFPDLAYTLETKNVILTAIDWLKHEEFIKDLKNRLTVDLSNPLNNSKSKIQEAINKKYGDVQLNGNVNNLTLLSLLTDTEHGKFTAYFNMSGHLRLSLP